MSAGAYLNNQLLVAMPSLADPNFSHSVTLVCEHNERGALGLVINRPLEMRMAEVLDQLSLETSDARLRDMPVLAGGPVQRDRGFVLHRPGPQSWESTMRVSDTLHVTTSRDVLAAMAKGEGPGAGGDRARLRGLGSRASSTRNCCRTPGSPCPATIR